MAAQFEPRSLAAAAIGAVIGGTALYALYRKTSAPAQLKLYNNKVCPFGQRAWISLLEKELPHTFIRVPLSGELRKINADPKGIEETQWADSGLTVAEINKLKVDYKKNVNPTGEVPTLVDGATVVPESDVVPWYLDHKFPTKGSRLLPEDPALMVKMKLIFKVISGGLIGNLYGLLKNQDPKRDVEYRGKIDRAFKKIASLAGTDGPYLLGKQFSYADVMLMPFYDRFRFLLKHYRQSELFPKEAAERLGRWARAIEGRTSFKKTSQGGEFYIRSYRGYAGARSADKAPLGA